MNVSTINVKNSVADAVHKLQQSERGQGVLSKLKELLDGGGYGLDSKNLSALCALVEAVRLGFPGTVSTALENYEAAAQQSYAVLILADVGGGGHIYSKATESSLCGVEKRFKQCEAEIDFGGKEFGPWLEMNRLHVCQTCLRIYERNNEGILHDTVPRV